MEDIVKHAFDTVIVGLFGTCCFVLAAFYCFPGIRDRVLTRDDERNEHVKTLMASSLWLLLPLSYVVGAVSFALGDQLFNEEPRGLVKVAQVLPDWLGVHVEADSTTRRKRPHISRAPLQSSMLMRMAEASEPASRRPQVIGHPATVMRGRILAKHRVGIDARRSRWRKGILVDSTTHFRPADATRESGRQDRMKSVKRAHAKAAT